MRDTIKGKNVRFTVLSKYVNETKLLKKLRDYAFSKDESILSAISLKFLAFIIHFQSRSSIEVRGNGNIIITAI